MCLYVGWMCKVVEQSVSCVSMAEHTIVYDSSVLDVLITQVHVQAQCIC